MGAERLWGRKGELLHSAEMDEALSGSLAVADGCTSAWTAKLGHENRKLDTIPNTHMES